MEHEEQVHGWFAVSVSFVELLEFDFFDERNQLVLVVESVLVELAAVLMMQHDVVVTMQFDAEVTMQFDVVVTKKQFVEAEFSAVPMPCVVEIYCLAVLIDSVPGCSAMMSRQVHSAYF